ncbi:MAG: hypothetical protein CMK53_09945 [Proteobacteria bacterium]|nr:hypothetical protein [Pseudomonadota bacterium]
MTDLIRIVFIIDLWHKGKVLELKDQIATDQRSIQVRFQTVGRGSVDIFQPMRPVLSLPVNPARPGQLSYADHC